MMAKNHIFTDFSYKLHFSPLKKKVCVEVSFVYDYCKNAKRYLFLDKEPVRDYIKEAKAIIQKEIESGELDKYVERYGKDRRKPLILALILAFLAVGAGAGYLTYRLLPQPGGGGEDDPVIFESKVSLVEAHEGYQVTLSNAKAEKDKQYDTDITLTHPTEMTYYLPSHLTKVTVNEQEIADTIYTYNVVDRESKAHLTIPATSITGNVAITLKLEYNQPVIPVAIKGSDECVGCIVNETTTSIGATEFEFTYKIQTEYKDPTLKSIKINDKRLTADDWELSSVTSPNTFRVKLKNGKTVDGVVEITLAATREPSGDTNLSLISGDNSLILCDENNEQFPNNSTKFNASAGITVRIEKPKETADKKHVPLDIQVIVNDQPLVYGTNYDYHFIDDEIGELTLYSRVSTDDVIIYAMATNAIMQFMYTLPANSEQNVTLAFETNTNDCYMPLISWGGEEEPLQPMEIGEVYKKVHTFTNTTTSDQNVIISVTPAIGEQEEAKTPPEFIGFDVNFDNRTGSVDYPDIAAPAANYASGIENVKAIKINTEIDGLIEEGLSHTSINSFMVPSNFKSESFASKHFAMCSDLDSIYVAKNNTVSVTDNSHKVLLDEVAGATGGFSAKLIANDDSEEGIILSDYQGKPIAGIDSFACAGRMLKKITIGQFCNTDYMRYGALACCKGLEKIIVDSNNTSFMIGKDNLLATPSYTIYATTKSFTGINFKDDGNAVLLPYSCSCLDEDASVKLKIYGDNAVATLYPYSFYNASNLETISLPIIITTSELYNNQLPTIYGCGTLKNVTFDRIKNYDLFKAGIIQKCPTVTDLSITVTNDIYKSDSNAIYFTFTDGSTNKAVLVGTCSASDLYNTSRQDYIISNFADYVFNGNAFGTNVSGVYPGRITIFKDADDYISPLVFVGMSDNAHVSFSAVDHKNYVAKDEIISSGKTEHVVYSKESINKTLYLAVLENLDTLYVTNRVGAVESQCMVNDPTLTKIVLSDGRMEEGDKMAFNANAFYNCPNLRTIDLRALGSNIHATCYKNSFIQKECTPFDPSTITVIVDSGAVDWYQHNENWSQFTIKSA